jgi:hypothetical protein
VDPIAPIPVDDLSTRDPEWAEIERGYGQETTKLRTINYSPILDEIEVEPGPVVVDKRPEAPAP